MLYAEIEIFSPASQETKMLLKEMEIFIAPRRVGQKQGQNDRDAKHYATGLLLAHEVLDWHHHLGAYTILVVFHHLSSLCCLYRWANLAK